MTDTIRYLITIVLLFALQFVYFFVAQRFHIVDCPNQRSSHTRVVLRGGGIIFLLGVWMSVLLFRVPYLYFVAGLTLVAGISFVDDIHSLPNWFRLIIHFIGMLLMAVDLQLLSFSAWWIIPLFLVLAVGIMNVYNFMDGINGITGAYSLSVLLPLFLINQREGFLSQPLILTTILSCLVFCTFNFRQKNHAICFAGDVGSIGMAFILIFMVGKLIALTHNWTYLLLFVLYGIDAGWTIVHRLMLHENLGQAHRKHAYQLMANELEMSHIAVSTIYALTQLTISLLLIYIIPRQSVWQWGYFALIISLLSVGYYLFMKRFYPLHEAYLQQHKS